MLTYTRVQRKETKTKSRLFQVLSISRDLKNGGLCQIKLRVQLNLFKEFK
jgi:hypothetical protein